MISLPPTPPVSSKGEGMIGEIVCSFGQHGKRGD